MSHPTASSVAPTAATAGAVPSLPVALVAPTWDDPLHTWSDPGAMWNGWVPTGGIAAAVDD